MTDEVSSDVSNLELTATVEPVSAVTSSPSVEEQARADGWVPLDEFKGNPDNWADAKEFVRVGKIIKGRDEKANKLEKEIKELKNITKSMLSTMQKAEQVAYDKAARDLEHRLLRAKEIGDVEEALDVSQKQQQLMEQVKVQHAQQQVSIKDSEEFQEFYPQNKWVTGTDRMHKAMQKVATELSNEYAAKHPNADLKDELSFIHAEIRKEFPEQFKSELRESSKAAVLTGSTSKPSDGDAASKLTSAEKSIVDFLKKQGYDTKAYLKALGK